MIDVEALEAALRAGLSLGTYTYLNGETAQAIAIGYGAQEDPPVGTRITGLECAIVVSPEVAIKPLLDGYQETHTVGILLKQWDESGDTLTGLDQALEAIADLECALQPGSIRRVMPLAKLGNIETMSFVVYQVFHNERG